MAALCSLLGTPVSTRAQTNAAAAKLQSEMDDAMHKVRLIVNQPVPAVRSTPGMQVSTFKPGWFHEGATVPDFNTTDVRLTRDTSAYDRHPYVTSDLNPGVAWLSRSVEFNPMTKYFYTNFTLPKKRLTEAEMVEINRLYRVIGKCEQELAGLQPKAAGAEEVDDPEGGLVLKPIPKERYVWAGIAIAVVLGIYFMVRKAR